jgi:GNAT superfamily N-acetyltransferase
MTARLDTQKIKIKAFIQGQELMIYELVKKVFDEFVAGDYSAEGNEVFYDWIEPSRIATRQAEYKSLFIAFDGKKAVGMIEMVRSNHISLFFVDTMYQKQGIARNLLIRAVDHCVQNDSKISRLTVNASPFSIEIYKKLGFRKTESMKEKTGIRYLPMEMSIIGSNLLDQENNL